MKDLEIQRPVTGITADSNQAKVAIRNVPDQPGIAAQLFGALADAHISVDMIIQSVQDDMSNDIAFTVTHDDLTKAVAIAESMQEKMGAGEVLYDDNIAKVSIVGVGMIGTPGIAAGMFEALAEANINIQMISTSEIKVSCVVDKSQAKKALEIIHARFIGAEVEV